MNSNKTRNKLNRFASQIAPQASATRSLSFPDRYSRLAEHLNGEIVTGPAGAYCLVKTFYPSNFEFGSMRLVSPKFESVPLGAVIAQATDTVIETEKLLFVDTETTGLGGAGTVPFLIGCGSIVPGGFEIRQYLLPDYADETELLEAVAAEIAERNCSVTYNGGPFDLPIIRDRMIINRVARELGFRHNLDLLPATRRLYKRRLRDCTLTNIEREIFLFFREDDTPGFLIPAIYFDWLSSENMAGLGGILEHNRWDILTMHFLLERLVEVAQTEGEVLDETDDLYSLQRLYQRRKDAGRVMKLCERLTEQEAVEEPDICLFQAMAFKRSGEWGRAVELWELLSADNTRVGYEANIELAKYYEHRAKQPQQAIRAVELAAKNLPESRIAVRELERRLNRLKSKL